MTGYSYKPCMLEGMSSIQIWATAFWSNRKKVTVLPELRFQERKCIIVKLISAGFAFFPGHLTLPHFISHMLSRPDSRFTLKRLHSQGHWEWRWGQVPSDWRMELWFMLGCKLKFCPRFFHLFNTKKQEQPQNKIPFHVIEMRTINCYKGSLPR